MKKLQPIHPGEILLDIMESADLSTDGLAKELSIPSSYVLEIVNCKRRITADTALRLARYFNTSVELWMGLQADYDLESALDRSSKDIKRTVKPRMESITHGEHRIKKILGRFFPSALHVTNYD